ncbi:MAG: RsmD family RNA methyltransferase [Prevotella sp.]|nr:RsmD family RNA methyltransferase [Prevotella sp.]
MRIITGKYKGRHFDIPRSFKARPTTDFAKENIFNVLIKYVDFDGATALDLFSGTGSISLELLSRGCQQVVSVELDRDHHRFIQDCIRKLEHKGEHMGDGSRCVMPMTQENRPHNARPHNAPSALPCALPIRGDVFRFLKSCHQQFHFIFADPPYALKEIPTLPDLIFERQLLLPDGIFCLEHGKDHDFSQHPHFLEHRQYGSVNFSLFK